MGTGAEIAAIIGAAAAVASAGTGIAASAGAFGSQSTPKTPTAQVGPTQDQLKALLPGAKADAAARTGGNISDSYLSDRISEMSGSPNAGLSILSDIQKSLGQQGP